MIPNPIRKVLSSIQTNRLQALLMGGQACVFYGAAEFSRDTDLAILPTSSNLSRLRKVLEDLQAEVIAVPPFELKFLRKGHAVHFRCQHPACRGLRLDIMTKMRAVDGFSKLWQRRTTFELEDKTVCAVMGLADLVKAKKTQRDKDWPMVQRLVEAHYFENIRQPSLSQIRFWLRELRTPRLLTELAKIQPKLSRELLRQRPLLKAALAGDEARLETGLAREQALEREADRRYWRPLKAELERLRHDRLRTKGQVIGC